MTNEDLKMPRLLRAEEVIKLMRINKNTFYHYLRDGVFPKDLYIKLGTQIRFKENKLREFLS